MTCSNKFLADAPIQISGSMIYSIFCVALNFEERIRGSHHIFTREGIEEILNLQPRGAKAKAYQVKQVRRIVLKYRLGGNL